MNGVKSQQQEQQAGAESSSRKQQTGVDQKLSCLLLAASCYCFLLLLLFDLLLLLFDRTHLLLRVSQDRLFDAPGGCNAARGVVSGFLKQVTCVPARPFPFDLMCCRRAIKTFPPRQVCLATKTTIHRFDNVPRISKYFHLARLRQRFESNCCGRNLSLLVSRNTEVFADGAPETFVTQQGHSRRATRNLPIPQARAVAENRDLLERSVFVFAVSHD